MQAAVAIRGIAILHLASSWSSAFLASPVPTHPLARTRNMRLTSTVAEKIDHETKNPSEQHDKLNGPVTNPNAVPLSTPQFNVEGKSFVVTGGTQGLGRTITEALFKAGAKGVVVANRGTKNQPNTEESLAEMQKRTNGGKLVYIPFDVTKASEAKAFIAKAEAELGEIHGLVNAAGQNTRGNLEDTTSELWDNVMAVNAKGPFFLIQAAGEAMRKKKIKGSIVSISSVMAHGGMPDTSVYTISKSTIDSVTKVTANQLKDYQIRVNAIHLGPCLTWNENNMQLNNQGIKDWIEKADQVHPFGRFVRMIDVASVVGHLLSDATCMVTDNTIEMHPDLFIGTVKNTYPME